MSYVKTNWVNGPNTATPLSAPNLNHLEGQYDAVKDDIADPSSPIGTVLSTTFAASLPASVVVRDATGRVASVTENGITETYTRDALGRVQTVTRGAVVRTVTRTPAGLIEEIA